MHKIRSTVCCANLSLWGPKCKHVSYGFVSYGAQHSELKALIIVHLDSCVASESDCGLTYNVWETNGIWNACLPITKPPKPISCSSGCPSVKVLLPTCLNLSAKKSRGLMLNRQHASYSFWVKLRAHNEWMNEWCYKVSLVWLITALILHDHSFSAMQSVTLC